MSANIKTVGVIGAGQMGAGIAQVFAVSGFDVKLVDVSDGALTSALQGIEARLQKLVEKERLSFDAKAAAVDRVSGGRGYGVLSDVDLVIEAATEREDIKLKIFDELMDVVRDDAIVTTNTSSISVTRLASATKNAENFMGLHFMNPVPVMHLVELIRGIATSQKTFDTMQNVVAKIGKQATVSEDYPAFIVNRVLIPMINEAVYVLMEGVGSVTSIDASMRLGANHPMGPLQLADFIGLDTCLSIMNVLNSGMNDPKYRPCPLLQKYVDAGWLGRKTGRGFYDYSSADPVPTR